ncbi:uncharacterized protein ACB057_013161 [Neosynchiropus ocellatus]
MVSNSSVAVQLQGELERTILTFLTGVPCAGLLTINCIILFTLRSKQVFRETCRYVLLINLLTADSIYMLMSQLTYILANSRVFLSYPVCGALVLCAALTQSVSPLTLAVMSVERYVAVCFPLRHSSIVTMRSTAAAIALVNSARKALSTLLLHMIQLVLSLSSRIFIPVSVALFQVMSWVSFVRMMNVMYVMVILLPRCLSSLIYGLRDQAIRPVLLSNLCCGLKPGVKTQISP